MDASQPQSIGSDVTTAQQAAASLGVPFTRIDPAKLDQAALALVEEKLAREYRVIPLSLDPVSRRLVIAVADSSLLAQPAPAFLQQLKKDGYQIEIEITPPADFEAALGAYQSLKNEVRSMENGDQTTTVPVQSPVAQIPSLPTSQVPSTPVTQVPVSSVSSLPPVQPSPMPAAKIPTVAPSLPLAPTAKSDALTPHPSPLPDRQTGLTKPAAQSLPTMTTPPAAQPLAQPTPVPASVNSTAVPTVSLPKEPIPASVLARFPADVARKYKMVVYKVSPDGATASVGAVNPDDRRVREILKFVQERNKLRIELGKISEDDLNRALSGYEASDSEEGRRKKEEGIQRTPPAKDEESAVAQSASADPPRLGEAGASRDGSPSRPAPLPVAQESRIKNQESGIQQPPTVQAAPLATTVPNLSQKPDLKLATNDTIKAVARTSRAPLPIKPMVTSASPAQPALKVGGVTATQSASQYQQTITRNSAGLGVDASGNQDASAPTEAIKQTTVAPAAPDQNDERNLDAMLGSPVKDPAELEQIVKSGMVPKIVAAAISLAVSLSASDIHIEASRDYVRLRFRVDGELREIIRVPKQLLAPFVSRIKILAKLKIDESRIPQDGRFDVWLEGREIDLRVSTLPTVHGEKVVLRILDRSAGVKTLDDLGIQGTNLSRLRSVIEDPFGIILVTGPTGSGKTSTLYALLSELNKDGVNIVTLEDPVEYQLEGVNQTQVKPDIGFGFADGLRSILRQDPNIVMVGEIRDKETAALATQAALTGHLVLSTLHTNDAAGAIPRMLDMGVEPFLLASSIKAVVGQRLVRRLDENGKQAASISPEILAGIKQELATSKAPEVLAAASANLNFVSPLNGHDSYHGRIGIYEVLSMSSALTELTLKKAVASSIAKTALEEGMVTMRQDGILKALAGVTSLEEVLTATADK